MIKTTIKLPASEILQILKDAGINCNNCYYSNCVRKIRKNDNIFNVWLCDEFESKDNKWFEVELIN